MVQGTQGAALFWAGIQYVSHWNIKIAELSNDVSM
jgi:hypothetical protein